jgi:hypothetical protein
MAMWGVRSHLKSLVDAVKTEFPNKETANGRMNYRPSIAGSASASSTRKSITGYTKTDSVLKEWNAEGVDSVLSLGRIVAEMSETIVVENEFAVKGQVKTDQNHVRVSRASPTVTESSARTNPSTLPISKPGLVRSASLSRVGQAAPEQHTVTKSGRDKIGQYTSELSSANAADEKYRVSKQDLLMASKICKYLRSRVYLSLILYAMKDIVPTALTAAQQVNAFARSDSRSFPSPVASSSKIKMTGSVPEYSVDAVRRLVGSDLSSFQQVELTRYECSFPRFTLEFDLRVTVVVVDLVPHLLWN